jgi:hypothetical protein
VTARAVYLSFNEIFRRTRQIVNKKLCLARARFLENLCDLNELQVKRQPATIEGVVQ